MAEKVVVSEVPDCVKKLIRLVIRTFETREDSFITDLLLKYSCLSERQMKELLKFDIKLIRQRLTHLKKRKFVDTRVRMECGGLKVIYYYLHYVNFINVVQYKLLMMRKNIENAHKVSINQPSLQCASMLCGKHYMSWETGECFDTIDCRFYCTLCKSPAEFLPMCSKKDVQSKMFSYDEELGPMLELLTECQSFSYDSRLMNPVPYCRGPVSIKNKAIQEEQPDSQPIASGSNKCLSGATPQMKKRFDGNMSVVLCGDRPEDPQNNSAPSKELPPWLATSDIVPSFPK